MKTKNRILDIQMKKNSLIVFSFCYAIVYCNMYGKISSNSGEKIYQGSAFKPFLTCSAGPNQYLTNPANLSKDDHINEKLPNGFVLSGKLFYADEKVKIEGYLSRENGPSHKCIFELTNKREGNIFFDDEVGITRYLYGKYENGEIYINPYYICFREQTAEKTVEDTYYFSSSECVKIKYKIINERNLAIDKVIYLKQVDEVDSAKKEEIPMEKCFFNMNGILKTAYTDKDKNIFITNSFIYKGKVKCTTKDGGTYCRPLGGTGSYIISVYGFIFEGLNFDEHKIDIANKTWMLTGANKVSRITSSCIWEKPSFFNKEIKNGKFTYKVLDNGIYPLYMNNEDYIFAFTPDLFSFFVENKWEKDGKKGEEKHEVLLITPTGEFIKKGTIEKEEVGVDVDKDMLISKGGYNYFYKLKRKIFSMKKIFLEMEEERKKNFPFSGKDFVEKVYKIGDREIKETFPMLVFSPKIVRNIFINSNSKLLSKKRKRDESRNKENILGIEPQTNSKFNKTKELPKLIPLNFGLTQSEVENFLKKIEMDQKMDKKKGA